MPSFEHSGPNRIEAILCAARRRRALILWLEQAAIALATVLAGAVLMLLLGTQILDWHWLAILGILGSVAALLRVRSRPIPSYRLAQILDHRLKLSDSLSTAWFLLAHSRRNDPVARFQIESAEKLAGSVRVAIAFPLTGRRRWAVSAGLAALALSLFGVRYLVTSSLSLKPALIPMQFGPVLEALEKPFSSYHSEAPGIQSSLASQANGSQQDSEKKPSNTLGLKPSGAAGSEGNAATENASPASDASQSSGDKQAGASGTRSAQQSPNSGTSQDSAQASQPAALQQSSSGLLSKMKDALSSLMAKLRANANSSESAPDSSHSAQAQKSADQAALGKDQHGSQQKAQGEPSGEQQSATGQNQGETTEKPQNAQARSASASSEHQGSDKQAGIGRQDGDKTVKEAEQLRAMGKLAEIIGKRSASLTGEMSVESSSQNQALKTEYSQRLGRHSDSGGEIDRDEIPLAYEQYVRDYMQEVRKQQPGTPPRTPE